MPRGVLPYIDDTGACDRTGSLFENIFHKQGIYFKGDCYRQGLINSGLTHRQGSFSLLFPRQGVCHFESNYT